MDLSGIHVDQEQVAAHLKRVKADSEARWEEHNQCAPALAAASLGKNFGERGRSIAYKLGLIHQRSDWRIRNIHATAEAACKDYGNAGAADGDSAGMLGKALR
ncbi:hypothetical protein H0194_07695 [Corynebacterium incognita]|uniref:Uncharacterized protein n=1 Tax=Corynebacterium incognita TaxID=2754725 RepID=A0A7G7CMZ4_9CORY|nr:hypothetical protein [Corynebacterium incognita]QNE88960.1 hypothetical protein H0194_07695 [Corynebacterium incognita]